MPRKHALRMPVSIQFQKYNNMLIYFIVIFLSRYVADIKIFRGCDKIAR